MSEQVESYSLVLSVGGMTCSACVNTISDNVSPLEGISNVVVHLLEGSCQAIISSREQAELVRGTIEDCGYDAQIVEVTPVGNAMGDNEPRVVSLRVDGMPPLDGVQKVVDALESLGSQIEITRTPSSLEEPVFVLSYHPAPPHLTIRTIITSITALNPTLIQVTVHHPPSIDALNRKVQLRERRRLLHRFFFALVAAVPSLIIGVVYASLVKEGNPTKAYLAQPIWAGSVTRTDWAMFIIATPVMFYSCCTFHSKSVQEVYAMWKKGSSTPLFHRFTRFGSMNLLVSLGVSVAYFSSVGVLGLAATNTDKNRLGGGSTTYFDTVVFLTMFLLAGRYLQAYSRLRTSDAISALNMLRPSEALLLTRVLEGQAPKVEKIDLEDVESGSSNTDLSTAGIPSDSQIERVSVDLLEVGDIVRVPSGSSPPADGSVLDGYRAVFDESSLTGESKLVLKQHGDNVFVGTINKGQMIHLKVEAIGKRTMLDQILQAVRQGQGHRAPIERIADVITSYFVPIITMLAVLVWVVWLGLGLGGRLPQDYLDVHLGGWPLWSLQFAIAVFVVACPCGIGLAAPTALLVGLGLAANNGILARGGGEAFQEMSQLDTIVFDKTGTLTEGGEPRVSDADFPQQVRWNRSVILGVASELESVSSHPLAIAMRGYCDDTPRQEGAQFEEVAGKGVKATFSELGCTAIIGNEKWIQEHGVELSEELKKRLYDWKSHAKSVALLAMRADDEADFHVVATFAVSDPIRAEARSVVSQLQERGISVWLLSGDNQTTASAVAASVGISAEQVIGGVLPQEKLDWIQRLQNQNPTVTGKNSRRVVAMVGDGINDAPALAVADVGIAIGSGSDIALSSASFILLSSDLRSVLALRDLSKRIINRIKFNFLWAIIYNMIAVPIAAGVLYPAGHIRLSPVWASLAMALSSVTVVMSSLLLRLGSRPKY